MGRGQAKKGNVGYKYDRGVNRVEYRLVNVVNANKRTDIEKNVMEKIRSGISQSTNKLRMDSPSKKNALCGSSGSSKQM
ncbi:hypothetical protein Tco_0809558 [Tanacetum coccineum]